MERKLNPVVNATGHIVFSIMGVILGLLILEWLQPGSFQQLLQAVKQ